MDRELKEIYYSCNYRYAYKKKFTAQFDQESVFFFLYKPKSLESFNKHLLLSQI
jgi:hypothetical protein